MARNLKFGDAGGEVLHLLRGGVTPAEAASRVGILPHSAQRIARTNFPEWRRSEAPLSPAEGWELVRRANNWLVGRYIARGLSDEQIRSLTDLPLAKVAEIRALRAA